MNLSKNENKKVGKLRATPPKGITFKADLPTDISISDLISSVNTIDYPDNAKKHITTTGGMMRIIFAFVVVFTIGIGLNRIIVNMIAGQMIMFRYQFVAWPMIAAIPLFLLIAAVIPGKIRWNNKEQT